MAPDPPRAPSAPGAVLVVVKPWAEVFVDGRTVGTTPLDRIPLPAGTHTVRVRHPLYEPIERTVTVREGQTERLEFDLAKVGTRKQ